MLLPFLALATCMSSCVERADAKSDRGDPFGPSLTVAESADPLCRATPGGQARLKFGVTGDTIGRVPAVPPDTLPAWFANDSSYLDGGSGPQKRVIVLQFAPSATQAQRQAAVDAVSGTVVGGSRMGASDGFYAVYVPGAVTLEGLDSAIVVLKHQPL